MDRHINQKKENLNNYDFLTLDEIKKLNPDLDKECERIKKHLEKDIKESEKSIREDKELEKTLGRMR